MALFLSGLDGARPYNPPYPLIGPTTSTYLDVRGQPSGIPFRVTFSSPTPFQKRRAVTISLFADDRLFPGLVTCGLGIKHRYSHLRRPSYRRRIVSPQRNSCRSRSVTSFREMTTSQKSTTACPFLMLSSMALAMVRSFWSVLLIATRPQCCSAHAALKNASHKDKNVNGKSITPVTYRFFLH